MAHINTRDRSPSPSTDLPWLTFSGSPTESASTFIQSVQRVAFKQRRATDDWWLAEYASTCFSDDALLWYSNLDEETYNSWRKLRMALLKQYYHDHKRSSARPIVGPLDLASASGPSAAASTKQASTPPSPSAPRKIRGRIEVFLYRYPVTVGFLAYNLESSKFSIVRDVNQAQVISFPKDPKEDIVSIRMEGLPVDTRYPFLGLALQMTNMKTLNSIPPVIVTSSGYTYYESIPAFPDRPKDLQRSQPDTAWVFRACTESSPTPRYRRIATTIGPHERASSAVWKLNENTNQLSITWMMDNDAECGLLALLHNGEESCLQIR